MRNPHFRIPAEDAVDRRGLCTHGQDAPPPAGVRQRGRPAKERVQGCHLEADEIVDHLEHVRAPASAFLAREHDEVDTVSFLDWSSKSEKASDEKCSPSAMPAACDLSQFYVSCRITGVPPLQSDFSGLSSTPPMSRKNEKKRAQNQRKWRGKNARKLTNYYLQLPSRGVPRRPSRPACDEVMPSEQPRGRR